MKPPALSFGAGALSFGSGALSFGPRNGQAIILVVVAMSLMLVAALGLAVDGGQMYAQRQMAQAAADAAAQAAVLSIYHGTNSTYAHPFATGSAPIASFTCTTSDGRVPCVYARNNGFGGASNDTVTVSFPSSVGGVTLNSVTVPAVTVSVQREVPTTLIRFVGPSTSTVTAHATAGMVGSVSPDCVYVLDPSDQNAITVSNGADVAISGCTLLVNSSNSDALTLSGGATISASAIDIVGNYQFNNGATTTPVPTTGVAAVTDPFVSLPAPSIGSCTAHPTMTSPAANATLSPGTYCGGITVAGGSTGVVFSAGTYIINGGGLNFAGGASASGTGVTFYLTGTNATYGSLSVTNGAIINFSAPTSGTYLGVLFYQDRGITSTQTVTFAGGTSSTFTGSLYFPTTTISFSNGATVGGPAMALISYKMTFQGGATVNYDSTGLKTGLFTKSVALVQ